MKKYAATAIKAVSVRKDGKAVMLVINTTEGEVAFGMPATGLSVLLPILIKAEIEAKARTGLSRPHTAFPVSNVRIELPTDMAGLLLIVALQNGFEMGFPLDIESARRLSASLTAYVAQSGEKPKTVQ